MSASMYLVAAIVCWAILLIGIYYLARGIRRMTRAIIHPTKCRCCNLSTLGGKYIAGKCSTCYEKRGRCCKWNQSSRITRFGE